MSRYRLRLLALFSLLMCLAAPADTIWWDSGALWHDAQAVEITRSATATTALVRYQGNLGWYAGLSVIDFETAAATSRPATVETGEGPRAIELDEFQQTESGAVLHGSEDGQRVSLPDWTRVTFADAELPVLDSPKAADPEPEDPFAQGEKPAPLSVSGEKEERLSELDAMVRVPAGWTRTMIGDEGASFGWVWTDRSLQTKGYRPFLALRARPYRVGGSGKLGSMLFDVMQNQFRSVLDARASGLAGCGDYQQQPVKMHGREWVALQTHCRDAAGNDVVVLFYGFAGRGYLHHLTVLVPAAQRAEGLRILNNAANSYQVPD